MRQDGWAAEYGAGSGKISFQQTQLKKDVQTSDLIQKKQPAAALLNFMEGFGL